MFYSGTGLNVDETVIVAIEVKHGESIFAEGVEALLLAERRVLIGVDGVEKSFDPALKNCGHTTSVGSSPAWLRRRNTSGSSVLTVGAIGPAVLQ